MDIGGKWAFVVERNVIECVPMGQRGGNLRRKKKDGPWIGSG